MDNKQLITNFYQAFAIADAESMIACYHDDIEFEDPAFGKLKGKKAKQMWQMLLSRNKDIKVTFFDVEVNQNTGTAKWKAVYYYGVKKRKVINNISANFEFKDGKISKHTDTFSMWKWSKQALGISGLLLGWTPFLKNKVQKLTNQLLRDFSKKNV
jgi:ketosteroid isomerase-like protein